LGNASGNENRVASDLARRAARARGPRICRLGAGWPDGTARGVTVAGGEATVVAAGTLRRLAGATVGGMRVAGVTDGGGTTTRPGVDGSIAVD
jgi:hypothetical protein